MTDIHCGARNISNLIKQLVKIESHTKLICQNPPLNFDLWIAWKRFIMLTESTYKWMIIILDELDQTDDESTDHKDLVKCLIRDTNNVRKDCLRTIKEYKKYNGDIHSLRRLRKLYRHIITYLREVLDCYDCTTINCYYIHGSTGRMLNVTENSKMQSSFQTHRELEQSRIRYVHISRKYICTIQ